MFARMTDAGPQRAKSALSVAPPRSLLTHAFAVRSTYADGGYLLRSLLERCATIARSRFNQPA